MTHLVALWIALAAPTSSAPARPRARDAGIPFLGTPGPLDAITDVAGVEVGHTTLVSGQGKLRVGQGPVRTGVTAILPRGRRSLTEPVFAGWFAFNGNGEMTGTAWIDEGGLLDGPIMLTGTHSVGVVRDAVIAWRVRQNVPSPDGYYWSLPVVAETWDGELHDVNGFHVKERHVFEALDHARGGPVPEGSVGGGTGMICHEWKGGIGTASRRVEGGFTVGALVQCNYGLHEQLSLAGVPVGRLLARPTGGRERGSIVIVIATDAPLLPHQLKRVARRAALGLARAGSLGGDGSGDLFIAFSTANAQAASASKATSAQLLPNALLDPIFAGAVLATEEAIANALWAADTMTGADGHRAEALPRDRARALVRRYAPP